jgi:hypothetical protein
MVVFHVHVRTRRRLRELLMREAVVVSTYAIRPRVASMAS